MNKKPENLVDEMQVLRLKEMIIENPNTMTCVKYFETVMKQFIGESQGLLAFAIDSFDSNTAALFQDTHANKSSGLLSR